MHKVYPKCTQSYSSANIYIFKLSYNIVRNFKRQYIRGKKKNHLEALENYVSLATETVLVQLGSQNPKCVFK